MQKKYRVYILSVLTEAKGSLYKGGLFCKMKTTRQGIFIIYSPSLFTIHYSLFFIGGFAKRLAGDFRHTWQEKVAMGGEQTIKYITKNLVTTNDYMARARVREETAKF